MARFRKPNLGGTRNYFQHFGRGILLLIGVLAIAALVVATFIYGDERRETVQQDSQPAEQMEQSEEDDTMVAEGDGDEDGAPATGTSDGTGNDGAQTAADGGNGEAQPQTIANTGPETGYALASLVLGGALYMYRRSTHQLKASRQQLN